MDFWRSCCRAGFLGLLVVLLAAGGAKAEGRKYALVIGIADYQDPKIPDLKFAHADAEAIQSYLLDPNLGGFDPQNVKLLVNNQATMKNILKALGDIQNKTTDQDTVIIYFAGHGAHEEDKKYSHSDGLTKYLITVNAEADNLWITSIPMDDFEAILAKMDAGCLVLIMDACFSGEAVGRTFKTLSQPTRDLKTIGTVFSQSITEKGKEQGKGRAILTASKENERALEYEEGNHGLFTFFFLQAVQGAGDEDQNGVVTLQETHKYVQQHVLEVSKKKRMTQHPVLKVEIEKGQIVLSSPNGIGTIVPPGPPVVFVEKGKYSAAKWSSLVVTGVAGSAAAAFYVTGNNYYQSWQDSDDPSEKNRLKQDTEDFYLYGQISAGVAGAAAVTTITFFVLDAVNNKKAKSASRWQFYTSVDPVTGAPMLGVRGIFK